MPVVAAVAGGLEVVAATLRGFDRQHWWQHPLGGGADTREAERGLAGVVAALRVWHAAATTTAAAAATNAA